MIFITLTLYALFGPDLLLMAGHSGMDQEIESKEDRNKMKR